MDWQNKKILVTGGNGFVGRHLIERLMAHHGVSKENIFAPRSSELDLRVKEQAQQAVKGRDIVFHLAAFSGGIGFSRTHPGRMFYDNALMGLNIVEAARAVGVKKFVHTGSYNEYPSDALMPLKEECLWNGLPEQSFLGYGMAKKMVLTQMQAYREEDGFHGIHLIMPSMFGPGYDPQSTTLIPSLIRQIAKAKTEHTPVVGWGTGKATRDFLYVEDAAHWIITSAERYDAPEPLNVGGGREVPMRELLETLCELMAFDGEVQWDSTKPEGQLRYVLDVSRAQQAIGLMPRTDLKTGLARTVEWASALADNDDHYPAVQ